MTNFNRVNLKASSDFRKNGKLLIEPAPSSECPIVLVCGFMGPGNDHWCERYWGQAMELSSEKSQVIAAPVSTFGSCHDRACELYALLRGLQVDYGEEHSKECGHQRFGVDYTGKGRYPKWNETHPIHLVGHSFGGNTVRAFRYLLSVDFFGHGTNSFWVRSTSTISAPLKGSLLTYTLGANQTDDPDKPVVRFSPGYMLGISAHFYELFCRRLGLDRFLDLGMAHWEFEKGGMRLFLSSLLGGTNGAGTPPCCSRDNAAYDLTMYSAERWNHKVQSLLEMDPFAYEFNLVASKDDVLEFSFSKARARYVRDHPPASSATIFRTTLVVLKDLFVSAAALAVSRATFVPSSHAIRAGGSDGVCSGTTQHFASGLMPERDLFSLSSPPPPGQYGVLLAPRHDHFSIVPMPHDLHDQATFFQQLFRTLRALPAPEKNAVNPAERTLLTTAANTSDLRHCVRIRQI